MNAKPTAPVQYYEICIKGYLDTRWGSLFEGLTLVLEEDGNTLLSGLIDQATLHGLLKKARDLGLPLVSVNQVQFQEIDPDSSNKGEK